MDQTLSIGNDGTMKRKRKGEEGGDGKGWESIDDKKNLRHPTLGNEGDFLQNDCRLYFPCRP